MHLSFIPQGVHTGRGAPFYFVWIAVFNFVIYSAVVYALGFGASRSAIQSGGILSGKPCYVQQSWKLAENGRKVLAVNNKDSATSVRRIRLGVFGASVLLGVFLALLPFAEERMRRGGHLLWLHFLAVDYLWLPGGLLASIRYPQGVHTGSGAPNYFVWVTVFNFVIYATLAYFVGVIVTRKRPSKRTFRA